MENLHFKDHQGGEVDQADYRQLPEVRAARTVDGALLDLLLQREHGETGMAYDVTAGVPPCLPGALRSRLLPALLSLLWGLCLHNFERSIGGGVEGVPKVLLNGTIRGIPREPPFY